ncbi:membrane protein [Microbacterium phage Barnstormer]|uniref:Membrane protein n=1 Tax=Microbacterium phage Barnstormer TaxID=3028491 RepID=A0AAE9ZJG9_9CAUD|nr:membrane protein [Microbacterium phage Barnstormer]WDS52146.1 membrane protein [Microbacterium phage UtzChips]
MSSASADLRALQRLVNPSPSPALVIGAAILAVVAIIVSLFIWAGIPLLIGLLVFPALGFTGWAVFGLTVATYAAWWLILALIGKLRR